MKVFKARAIEDRYTVDGGYTTYQMDTNAIKRIRGTMPISHQ